MRRLVALVAALLLAFPAAASARPLLGVHGAVDRFDQLTGQRTQIRHIFLAGEHRARPELPGGRADADDRDDSDHVSPLAIARGSGDGYLFALNDWLARRGGVAYVRPMPEMNGHWNAYCAYTKSGRLKGDAYSTVAFRKAFARIAVLVRGGSAASVNSQLARLKLPPVSHDLPALPAVRIVWNPQGYGSPDLPGNSAQAYYPGDRYVDVVGNDLYYIRGKAEWPAAERLYAAHPSKPYAFAEWGLWNSRRRASSSRSRALRENAPPRRARLVLQRQAGLAVGPRLEASSGAAYKRLIVPLGG